MRLTIHQNWLLTLFACFVVLVVFRVYLSDGQQYMFRVMGFSKPVLKKTMTDDGNSNGIKLGHWKLQRDVPHLAFVICGDRLPEAMVMLKSALIFTKSFLVLHIVTDSEVQMELKNQLEALPSHLRSKLDYTVYNTSFPTDIACEHCTKWKWKTMFRLCSSQRLFFTDVMPDVDSVLYVDLDVLFLAPVEELWSYIFKFNSTQFVAAVPFSVKPYGGYYSRSEKIHVPFIPPTGINAGVLLLNLTRLQKSSWKTSLPEYFVKYQQKLILPDQDLVNIYMAYHPETAYLLPCEWNYRHYFCKSDNRCLKADKEGAALLHGISYQFLNNENPAFKATYSAFKQFQLGNHSIKHDLLKNIKSNFNKTVISSKCGTIPSLYTKKITEFISQW